jgi:hypothetical protein
MSATIQGVFVRHYAPDSRSANPQLLPFSYPALLFTGPLWLEGPVPAFYAKGPRTYKIICLYRAEFKYISNSDEKVNGYLAGLARYDILEEKGLIPHKLRQLRNTRAAPSSDIR